MTEEVLTEEEKGEIGAEEVRKMGAFFGAEAIIMFPIAGLLDLIGIILICFALDDFWIADIIGILTIGLWTLIRSRVMKVTYRTEARITKAITKTAKWARRLRWLRPLLVILEFIPYVGAAPCWVLLVYFELKYS
jgi:hypothetical protein